MPLHSAIRIHAHIKSYLSSQRLPPMVSSSVTSPTVEDDLIEFPRYSHLLSAAWLRQRRIPVNA